MTRSGAPLAFALLLGCSEASSSSAALGEGVAAPEVHAVVHVSTTGGLHCTGTVIGPRHVLTSKECIWDGTRPFAPDAIEIALAATVDASTPRRTVLEVLATAEFPRGMGDTNDLALLVTTDPLGITPLPVATVSPRPDQALTLVGYGEDASGERGVRRQGSASVESVSSGVFTTGGPAGLCDGDLGGPALDASGAVVGVGLFVFALDGGEVGCPAGSGFAGVVTYRDFLVAALPELAPDAGVEAPDAAVEIDAGVPPPPTDAATPAPTDAGSSPAPDAGPPPSGGGGCHASPRPASAPALLALAFALVAVRRRVR